MLAVVHSWVFCYCFHDGFAAAVFVVVASVASLLSRFASGVGSYSAALISQSDES